VCQVFEEAVSRREDIFLDAVSPPDSCKAISGRSREDGHSSRDT